MAALAWIAAVSVLLAIPCYAAATSPRETADDRGMWAPLAAVLLLIGVFFTVAAVTTPPARAGEIHDTYRAQRTASEPLTRTELRMVTESLLSLYIGPAVTNDVQAPTTVKVDRCRVLRGNRGACRGRVQAGSVLCEGQFRIRKLPDMYYAWPLRMVCQVVR